MTDDTFDWGEFSDAMRKRSKEKRYANRESTPVILNAKGIQFESKNNGAHLIVKHRGKVADLWPGTGKWIIRGTGKYRRGVFKLIEGLTK